MKDDVYWRTAIHEAGGHSLAAFLLTGQFGAVSLKADGSALCDLTFPTDWPVNDHRHLIFSGLTTAAGLAAESLMLGDKNYQKGRKDLADLDAICGELAGIDLYKAVQVSTLTDLMETAARALLRPHQKAIDHLAHRAYDKGALTADECYYTVVGLFPQYREAVYQPMLKGPGWLSGWNDLLATAEDMPHLMDRWRGEAVREKHEALQAQHRALALTLARDVD